MHNSLEIPSLLSLYALVVTDAILGNCASYARALSPVERVLRHFQWDPGLISETKKQTNN